MTDLNAVLFTVPVWSEDEDTGGMFPSTMKVHYVPERGYLASFSDGWSVKERPTWHNTLDEAKNAARANMLAFFGLEP